jgi:hypothetical protein
MMAEHHHSMMKMMQFMHKNMEAMPMHKQIKMAEHHLEMMENMMPQIKHKMAEMKDSNQQHSHKH